MISRVEAQSVRVERGGRTLLDGLTFTVRAGEALAVTGPNGAGKTSLLRCIAGLLRPAEGAISFGDTEAESARSRGLHWLGPQDGLKGQRTAEAELRFWARWNGGDRGANPTAALDALGLASQRGREVRHLSTGQRRRLALARLLAAPRPLWLLDEPLAPLDAALRERLGELMRVHLQEGGLIVAAVHDPLPVPARTLQLGGPA